MGNDFLRRIGRLFKKMLPDSDAKFTKDQLFRMKVLKICRHEKDFTSLYDYEKIISLSDVEQCRYLANVTKKYLEEKQRLIDEGSIIVE